MNLNPKQKKFLRAQAHSLNPVVIIGQNGLTENVMQEINLALNHHELIKVRVNADTKEDRLSIADNICNDANATLVQQIGHVISLYKQNAEQPTIQLPR